MPQVPQKPFLAREARLPESILLPRPVVTPVAPLGAEEALLTNESSVYKLRAKCVELGRAVWGTKQQLYERIQVAEKLKRKRDNEIDRIKQAAADTAKGISTAKVLPVPEMPSEEEQRKHELTHLPTARWCTICQMGKASPRPTSR